MRRSHVLVALTVGLVALLTADAMAQAVTRSYPVGVKFDGELFASRVFVRFSAQPIGERFDDFAGRTLDGPAKAFVRLVRAARADDVAAARPNLDLAVPGQGPSAEVLKGIAGLGGGWDRADIVARYTVDGSTVFAFRADRAEGPATGGMAFRQQNGVWKGRILTSRDPALSLIIDALHNNGRQPTAFAPVDRAPTAYAIPISRDDSVWLEFDGQIVDFDPMDSRAAPTSEATALYQQAMLTLAAGNWTGFASMHSPGSQAKIEGWLANQGRDPRASKAAAGLITQNTRVLFEMDLGPGVMLLYAQGDQVADPDKPIKKVMVARTRGGLVLTNYYMTYQFGLTLMRSPRWPKRAGELLDLLARSKR